MLEHGSTIIIPVFRQPHLLLQAIRGIQRHSIFVHRIIVVYADGRRLGHESDCADWAVDDKGNAVRGLTCVDDVRRCTQSRDVKFRDCTEMFLTEGQRGSATDAAQKSNAGLAEVVTPWVCPSWDADYYPLPRWDERIDAAMEATGGQGVYVPQFKEPSMRPVKVRAGWPEYPATFPGWCGYLTRAEVSQMGGAGGEMRTTSDWADTTVSINPQWWRTDSLGKTVPMPIDGGTPEWELSKKAQAQGLQRIMHTGAGILHKYSVVRDGMP